MPSSEPAAQTRAQHGCFLCGDTNPAEGFSDEHVFQASIGGKLVAPGATCRTCNRECSAAFEAKFLNSVKVLTNVLGIANRKGDVPNIDITFRIDGQLFKGVLHADGELEIQNKSEQQRTADGKLLKRWWLFNDESFENLQNAAAKRGEQLVTEEPGGRDIELVPESFMPLDFIDSPEAKRTAAKVALTCVAAKLGQNSACSRAFDVWRCRHRRGKWCSGRPKCGITASDHGDGSRESLTDLGGRAAFFITVQHRRGRSRRIFESALERVRHSFRLQVYG